MLNFIDEQIHYSTLERVYVSVETFDGYFRVVPPHTASNWT